jgi:SET domain-containing protein
MFNINGGLHVLIYTIRDIEEGETLFYDYNAGKLDEVDTNLFD